MINRKGRFVLHNNDVEAIAACLGRRAATVAKGPAVIVGAGGSAAAMLEALRRVPPARGRAGPAAGCRQALVERVRGGCACRSRPLFWQRITRRSSRRA